MPTYDYRCPSNGEVIEVRHSMDEQLTTWGELCQAAERELGDTPADAPVERLLSAASVLSSGARTEPEQPACCSPEGMCGCR
ncbi:zinc ribbon domain-containing protein [Halorhodospira halochloris]|uniref:zinc ribbon domain-containing protein n=1 Tax=Halorhodospira halochloris TaxID=1052 RepID=UPI001EE98F29|nr:zinc ribbon domain-containing protein [Halorhodospira halochloris]MCG5530915.1 zinc ribbon domain-containing protein [Halorhodospira halochloris]